MLAYSYNFTNREQNEFETIITQKYNTLINAWYEYFGQNK